MISLSALYVHSLPVPQHGLNSPESIGFAKNQVTPFLLNTTDGEELYGWHILPIGLYAKHEDELLAQSIEMNFKTSKVRINIWSLRYRSVQNPFDARY
jgi:hypothetical protein